MLVSELFVCLFFVFFVLFCFLFFVFFVCFLDWPIRNTKDSGDDNFNLGQARPHRSTETATEKMVR